jgi:hypothetical protein
MAGNYDGLTRNLWPGTWSASASHPIVLDAELRGSLRSISGASGSRLTDITGQRLQEGMLVFVKTGYIAGGFTRDSGGYYQYNLLTGESRDVNTGASPNAEANWSEFVAGGGGGTGPTGPTGEQGEFITTLTVTVPPATMLTPTSFVLSGTGGKVQSEEAYVLTINGIFVTIREAPNVSNIGDEIHIGIFSVSVPSNYYLAFTNISGTPQAELFINDVTSGFILTSFGYELSMYANGINFYITVDGVQEYTTPLPGNSAQSFGFFAEAVTLNSPVTYSVVKFFPTGLAGVAGITGPTGIRGSAFYYGTDLNNPQGPVANPSIGDLFLNTETGQLYVKLT